MVKILEWSICSMNAELLTVSQTAQYLQLSEKTIRRLIENGKLPASKLSNRSWRIRASDIDDYVIGSCVHKAVNFQPESKCGGMYDSNSSTYFALFWLRWNGFGLQKSRI